MQMSLWSITQITAPRAVFLPLNPNSPHKNGFHFLSTPQSAPDIVPLSLNSTELKALVVRPDANDSFKIGVDAPASTVVAVWNDLALRQSAPRPEGQYPDGADGAGFPVELFDIGGTGGQGKRIRSCPVNDGLWSAATRRRTPNDSTASQKLLSHPRRTRLWRSRL